MGASARVLDRSRAAAIFFRRRLTIENRRLHCAPLRAPDVGESASRVWERAADEWAICDASSKGDAEHVAQADADGFSQEKDIGVVDRKTASVVVSGSRKRFAGEDATRLAERGL
jgi:hypothetical protein